MSEIMTLAEIREQYDSEWILLENPQTDDGLAVQSGKVLCHSKNRDEVYRRICELKPQHAAIIYAGELPDGAVVVL